MSKWKTVKLRKICEIVTGSTPSTLKQEYWDGSFYWVTPAEISDGDYYIERTQRKLTEAGITSAGLRIMPVGTVLLSSRAPIGKVAITAVEMACNQGFKNFVCGEKIHNRFLYYFLKNNKHYLNSLGRGATFKEISKSIVCEIEIPLPPLEEQKHIADILDKATNLIDLRKQQLEKMDSLIKSKFIYMFGDPVTNPKGWDVKKIGELTNVFTGATPNKSIDEYYCGNIPWVKTGEISKEYIWEAEERITKKALKETNCKIFPINTIMVAMYGQGKTRGQAGLLKIEASTNQACAAIVPNESYCTEYLFKLIQLSYETLRSLGRGGNQPNLNLSMIKEFLVMCPPVELQNQFAEFVEQVEKQKAVMQQSLEKMETNYKA